MGSGAVAGPNNRGRAGQCISVVLAVRALLDRQGLAALLRTMQGIRVVGQAASAGELQALCARRRPAVAIVDTSYLQPVGTCRVADVTTASPRTRILAIPPHDVDWCAVLNPPARRETPDTFASAGLDCLRLALQAGVHGVVRRSCSARELVRAIHAVAAGRSWVGSDVALQAPPELPLSRSELRVASLVGQGRSNKEIAAALSISELTVKKHVSHILRKLKLQDRLQLGLFVARHASLFASCAPVEPADA